MIDIILDRLQYCAVIAGGVCSIIAAVTLCVKPIRDKVFGLCETVNGLKCLLRADMLHIYYKNRENGSLRQYERENFAAEYKAYKALGGNSFIDDIFMEVKKWETLT